MVLDISPPALSMAGVIIPFLIAIERLIGMLLTTIAVARGSNSYPGKDTEEGTGFSAY